MGRQMDRVGYLTVVRDKLVIYLMIEKEHVYNYVFDIIRKAHQNLRRKNYP